MRAGYATVCYRDLYEILSLWNLCYTDHAMDDERLFVHFEEHMPQWRHWIHGKGLASIVGFVLDSLEPFSMIGAQMLYVGKPTLSLFGVQHHVEQWARLLETPGGLQWLREQLTEMDDVDD